MSTMSFWIFLLFFVEFSWGASSSVSSIFPPQYSYSFDSPATLEIKLSEAVLSGDKMQQKFGISLWVKIFAMVAPCPIFTIISAGSEENSSKDFIKLYYSYDSQLLSLHWLDFSYPYISTLNLPCAPSPNWIFIGISAGFENKSCLLYYNNLGSESYISGFFNLEISIKVNSFLRLGNSEFTTERIGDFRIHNNIYNEVSDWRLQYSSSCAAVSCASLFPSIDYGKCDQWCASETERFFPLFEPVLYSDAPYLTIFDEVYQFNYTNSVYYDISPSLWNDFSITGWFQFQRCYSGGFTFLMIYSRKLFKVQIKVDLTTISSNCDTLKATIYSTDGTNEAYDSVSITSSSYIGSWFFFAVTLNSGSKKLTLYSKDWINPPSNIPLLTSPVYYTYAALPFDHNYMDILIGGFNNAISPGDYADFRFYPGNFIDTTLLQYNNNIYSPATYLDPNCLSWASIWYCDKCDTGYFLKNGFCQKCHYSCVTCNIDETDSSCLDCAAGYFAQPGHLSMCFDYCPFGYEYDYSLNQCLGTPGSIMSLNFDDNLSGKIEIPGIKVKIGMFMDDYYPNFDYFDPYPANKRGLYFNGLNNVLIEKSQPGVFANSDFTIEIWAMPILIWEINYLFLASTSLSNYHFYDSFINKSYNVHCLKFFTEKNELKFTIKTKENGSVKISMSSTNNLLKEWELYSVSVSFNSLSKTSQVSLLRNKYFYTETISSYYKEVSDIKYNVGAGIYSDHGFFGYIYSFKMYNYEKSYSEIIQDLGTCTSCSAYPVVLNSCLPACDKNEYVDENGICQKCSSKCSWICSRADTCNLCYDDLCYKCTKYEIGACVQCIANAVLTDGKCKCQSGYIRNENECVGTCGDGYYLDLNAQKCLSCPDNCLKCDDGDPCILCKIGFTPKNGKCTCMDGYFIDSSNKCLKCDSSCLTCSDVSSNCTSCISSQPILYVSNKCYPCDSFEGFSTYFSVPISFFTDDLFSKLSLNCIEICGDGRNMGQAQCDDGNSYNGDGCSSSCKVETGWSCFGGSANSPDMCKDITPPKPNLAYLSENNSGYLLTLSFSEAVNFGTEISKNIEVEIENNLKFSWSITEKNSLYFITLIMHESVSAGTSVKVTFKNPNSIVDMNGNEMKESSVSTNLLKSFVYTIGQAIKSSVTTATAVTAASSALGSLSVGFFMGSFNFQALWSMVEIMQIQNYLIFLSPNYPDNLVSYLEALGIANGNFLPNPFQLYLVKNDPFSDPPQKFIEQNYNTDFLMNSGQFILIWVIILLGLPISLLLYKFWPRFSIIRKLKNSYSFSVLLRTGIESFLEITLSVLLQLREFSQPSQDIGYISLTLSILTLAYLVLTFALIIWQVTMKSKQTLDMKIHERQFGALYEEFKRDSRLSVSFLLFQNSRRVLFVIFCVFLYDYTTMQVSLSVSLSFIYTLSLILLRPFKSLYFGNGLHILCELFYFISNCLILKLLDGNLSDNDRTNLGWAIISLLGMSLMLHIISIFIVQTANLINGIKEFKNWFMKNFANKFVKIRKRVILLNKIPYNGPKNAGEGISESMAYFEGKTPEKLNKESIYNPRSTEVKTSDTLYISTYQNKLEIAEDDFIKKPQKIDISP